MEKINLENILLYFEKDCQKNPFNYQKCDYRLQAMKVACRQSLELAAEKAEVTHNSYMDLVDGCKTYIVDKQSILDVINLIE